MLNANEPPNNDPKIPEPPEESNDLYGVGGTDWREPEDESARLAQIPKDHFVEPPKAGADDLYAFGADQLGRTAPDPESLRHQMPKERFFESPETPPDELYGVSDKSGAEGPTDEKSRAAQMPKENIIAPTAEIAPDELYSVSEKTGSAEERGPDLRVLFADAKISPDEVYGVGGNATAPPPPPPEEKSTEKQSDAGDVYGVSAPSETIYAKDVLRPGRTYEDPDEKLGKIAGNADLEGDVSLELIYGRRQEHARSSMFDEPDEENEEEHVEKSPLPKHPFINRIFRPFWSPGFLLRILMMTFAALVPFYPGTYMFSRMVAGDAEVQAAAKAEPVKVIGDDVGRIDRILLENPKIGIFFGCLYQARIILFLVCFVWGVFAIPYYLHVFSATAAGDDRIDEWPELNMMGGIGQFLWMILIVFLGGVPGYLLFTFFDLPIVGFIFGAIFLSPIIFLSCMETDTLFTPVSPNIFNSFFLVSRAWRRFYLISVTLYIFAVCAMTLLLWEIVWVNEENQVSVFAVSFQLALLFSVLPIIYLRYLGRLAWVVQEKVALARQQKEELEKRRELEETADSQSHPLEPPEPSKPPET